MRSNINIIVEICEKKLAFLKFKSLKYFSHPDPDQKSTTFAILGRGRD